MKRLILIPAILMLISGGSARAAQKQPVELTPAQADSCAAAFATTMAMYLKPELERRFQSNGDSISEFVRGVGHALDIKNVDAPYYQGVRNGFAIIDRLGQMQAMGFPISDKAFLSQLDAALKGQAMGMDADKADAYLRHAMELMMPVEEPKVLSPESQQAYLDENRGRQGVIETPTGLLFEVITEGEGATPKPEDTVSVTYAGRLSDGEVFDSSEKPVRFPVNRLVPGFTEGLQMMKPGGTYRIIIPPVLGYGDSGAGGVIPPGAVLDFTVTLHDIIPADKPVEPAKAAEAAKAAE